MLKLITVVLFILTSKLSFAGDNLFINPEVRFDQIGEGKLYHTDVTREIYGPDNYRFYGAGAGNGTFNVSRSGESPINLGFTNSLKLNTTSASTSSGANDNYHIEIPIEGKRMRGLGWGYAAAKNVTFQFLFRSSVAGDYTFTVMEGTNSVSYRQVFSYSGSGAFEPIVITVPGPTVGVWQTSPATFGAKILIDVGTGSNFEAAPGIWTSGASWRVAGTVKFIEHQNAVMHMTGFQTDIGNIALPFRFETTDYQQREVQQFIYKTYPQGVQIKAVNLAGALSYISEHDGTSIGNGVYARWPVEMSSTPIIVTYNPITNNPYWCNRITVSDSGAASPFDISSVGAYFLNPQVGSDTAGANFLLHTVVSSQLGTDLTALLIQINQ